MKSWYFRLIDTGFFRDGTPFDMGETGAYHQSTLFPPLMTTIQGAVRTSLARSQGWLDQAIQSGQPLVDVWDRSVMGDQQSTGQLQFRGPYLLRQGERLYPVPRTMLFDISHQPIGWLTPGRSVESDMGKKRFPKPTVVDGKNHLAWVTGHGLANILNQQFPKPQDLFVANDLWKEERRVGIKRDVSTHQALEGHLFTASHIRPEADLQMVIDVEGVPNHWNLPPMFAAPLGGEGRFAEVTVTDSVDSLDVFPDLDQPKKEKVRFTVSLVTPLAISSVGAVIEQGPLPMISCISASVGRPFTQGGWDLKKNEPRDREPMIPAGSTWYYEADRSVIPQLQLLHGTCVGEKESLGFGEIRIGKWEEINE